MLSMVKAASPKYRNRVCSGTLQYLLQVNISSTGYGKYI